MTAQVVETCSSWRTFHGRTVSSMEVPTCAGFRARIYRTPPRHMITFLHGEPARCALVKWLTALDSNEQRILYIKHLHDHVITVKNVIIIIIISLRTPKVQKTAIGVHFGALILLGSSERSDVRNRMRFSAAVCCLIQALRDAFLLPVVGNCGYLRYWSHSPLSSLINEAFLRAKLPCAGQFFCFAFRIILYML